MVDLTVKSLRTLVFFIYFFVVGPVFCHYGGGWDGYSEERRLSRGELVLQS